MTNPKWLEVAARSSGQHTWTLGHVFEKYRENEGKSAEALAEELGCSLERLAWLSLCRRPSEEHFTEHLEQIGKRFEVEPHRLAAVIRHVDVLDALPASWDEEEEGEESFLLAARDYRASLGEDLSTTLDLRTWEKGWEIERLISHIHERVSSAESTEARIRAVIRQEIFPDLKRRTRIPEAGVYEASPERLKTVFESLLFPGRVEAVSSITSFHDSLVLGITQLGVAVVGYGGLSGTFSQRLFRKDVSARTPDTLKVVQDCLKQRHERGPRDELSMLMRRYIRAYAERAILLDKSQAEWRIGLGNPCSQEMLSGANYRPLLSASLDVLRRLIREHKKFVFVSRELDEEGYLTIGSALNPGEYAILHTLEEDSSYLVRRWHSDGRMRDEALAFVKEYCPEVFIGLFRASEQTPPRLFYAHREHVHIAAHLALADSIVQPDRGFPMLLDVADVSCRSAFGSESFRGLVNDAYKRAGSIHHYFGERPMPLDVADVSCRGAFGSESFLGPVNDAYTRAVSMHPLPRRMLTGDLRHG